MAGGARMPELAGERTAGCRPYTGGARAPGTAAGLRVRSLPRGGLLFMAGMRPRDLIISVNGRGIADELDFYYHAAQEYLEIEIERGGRTGIIEAQRPPSAPVEAEFYEKPVSRCANRCIFCFIDQMPEGLRRGLYVKDEDFKHSFLNGNYVTLASASREDLERVAAIGLSPLFVSVHATDKSVRAAMLGNKRIPDICGQLAFLSGNGVAFHTQIVLCPGINDGGVLERTVRDLFAYGKSLLSIAVVPVGLTRFRKRQLAPVDKACAIKVVKKLDDISMRMMKKDGIRKLFAADEFFIKAGMPIPPARYYEDYPQIENGVGLVRQLLQDGAKAKRRLKAGTAPSTDKRKNKNYLVITGRSAYPFLKKVLEDISPYTYNNYDVAAVENRYLGESVTVAGLLTAKDVIRKIKESSRANLYAKAVLPRAMFNHEGYTLDGYSPARIGKAVNLPIKLAQTIEDII